MGKRINKFNTEKETQENQQKLGKKKYTIHDLIKYNPKTDAQNEFWQAYKRDTPVIFQVGPAGTGKTAVALWNAFYEMLDDPTSYEKIIIIRPPVATVDLGFMPGDEEEKENYYSEAYRNIIDEMFKYNTVYDNLNALGLIEFRTSANLRGLSLKRSIIIVDEFQSADLHSLKTIFTRQGEGSKIIFCGDFGQNDLRGKKGTQQSGYTEFMRIIDNMKERNGTNLVSVIKYSPEDVVRSGIVKEFIISCYELDL